LDFYTNVSLQGGRICAIGYEDGIRVQRQLPYEPYLFLPTTKPTKYKSIHGQPLEKRQFNTVTEVKQFIKTFDEVNGFSYFGIDRWVYQYIHDNFDETINYDVSLIKIAGIDIEADSEDGYPNIELADKKITSISYRLNQEKIVFGYGDYIPHEENITYVKCTDEEDLLRRFLAFWNTDKYMPDIITGWNIEGFDIPYLVKRITYILGPDAAKRLSPWNWLKEKEMFIMGKTIKMYQPVGICVLDYLPLYKKFTQNELSSYSLNNVCHVELKEKKLDYSEYKNLAGLYKNNHQRFIEYNVRDTDLVFKLEAKLKFIELALAIAYDAHVNIADAFTSVLLWDIIIYNYLANKDIIVPSPTNNPERSFEGGFVKEPLIGLHKNVMSVDLTSLYPHCIIQYQISPETFVDKLQGITVDKCLATEQFDDPQYAMAANGCRFRKDIKGFLPALMETQFAKRKEYQKLMKAEKDETKKVKFDKAQHAKKIQINALFGCLANCKFRFYDPNFAEAITLSGQLSIRFMADQVNTYINKISGTSNVDYIIAIDTDSLYISLDNLVQKYGAENPIDFMDKFGEDKLIPFINKKYEILSTRMNAYKQAMNMKRENIADKALWTAKKRYIMNVWDKEGKRYDAPELKIMGIETVRSTTPAICKTALEESIKIVMNKNEQDLQKFISNFKIDFFKAPFDEVATPKGVNNIEGYMDSVTLYKKGTPIHVKGAIRYNKMIQDRKLKTSIPIYSGDKIKYAYLKMPNPVHDTVIASPGFLPFEDVNDYIDYNTQWEKMFIDPLQHIISYIGWHTKKQDTMKGLFKRKSSCGS
jgi:DNA polymerase elongation subunit (family B)